MKKLFLFVILLTVFIGNIVSAEELILVNKDNFEVKVNSFIKNEENKISLVKKSDMTITFKNNFEEVEPKINFEITNQAGDSVLTLKSPSRKMGGGSPDDELDLQAERDLDAYLLENKDYFDHVLVDYDKVEIELPLVYEAGAYNLNLTVDIEGEKSTLEYPFEISLSPFNFTNTDILIEDNVVLANIGYESFLDEEVTGKVLVTLTQNNQELFKKETEKTFYMNGVITVDEEIEILQNLSGTANLRIDVQDNENQTILSLQKEVELTKSSTIPWLYISLLTIFLLLIAAALIYIKKNKIKIPTVAFLSLAFFAVAISPTIINAQTCDPNTKPADYCIEDSISTFVCLLTQSCEELGQPIKKFFSSGTVLNIASPRRGGSASASVNICTSLSEVPINGTSFYVTSDSNGSSWERKRYHVFNFVKATNKKPITVTFDPGGRKRNVNYATYDGNCTVQVFSQYKGADSDSTQTKTTIVEVGTVDTGMCKSIVVNSDVFETNGTMLGLRNCSAIELSDVYIVGGVAIVPPEKNPTSSWKDHSVNVCTYLGINPSNIPVGKQFYALMNQTSAWWNMSYPIFQYTFGTATKKYSRTLNGTSTNNQDSYYFGRNKENSPSMIYDGACTITFRLYNYGENTDAWKKGYDLIELGMVEDALCKAPILTAHSSYSDPITTKKPTNNVEYWVKVADKYDKTAPIDGKYHKIAPMMLSLPNCSSYLTCSTEGSWIELATDQTCIDCDRSLYTEDEIICDAGYEYVMSCSVTGEWKRNPTGETCTSAPVSCRSSSNNIEQGDSVTFTASPQGASSYVWKFNGNPLPGQTARTYPTQLNTTGMYTGVSVDITTGGATQNAQCNSVRVCEPKPADGDCALGGVSINVYRGICNDDGTWTPEVESCLPTPPGGAITKFKFVPPIADPITEECELEIEAQNVSSCTLTNRLGTSIENFPADATNVVSGSGSVEVGTWTLICTGLGDPAVDTEPVVRSCSSNPNFGEF